MPPTAHLHIQTRRGDVSPHMRGRWMRAGGTSWAHQAQSITWWQEPFEHGGASVEPQVKMYFTSADTHQWWVWTSCFVCREQSSHIPWHVNIHCTHTFCIFHLTSALSCSFPPHLWHHRGQTSPDPPHLNGHCSWTLSTQTPSRHSKTQAVSGDLAPIAKVWTENGRCEMIKCTIHWGPAAPRPRFRDHIQVVESYGTWTTVMAEECLKLQLLYVHKRLMGRHDIIKIIPLYPFYAFKASDCFKGLLSSVVSGPAAHTVPHSIFSSVWK